TGTHDARLAVDCAAGAMLGAMERQGGPMLVRARNISAKLSALLLALAAVPAVASVSVTTPDANTAIATISLTDTPANTYTQTVRTAFDNGPDAGGNPYGAINLPPDSIGIPAELIDPANPPGTLPAGVTVDPAFPVLVSVWPPSAPDVIMLNGLESNQVPD